MLSEELRNLALWISTRRRYRAMLGVPCDPSGEAIVSNVLEELAEQAERMESHTRMTGAEVAERIALEAYEPRSR
jgi:hypothetical protein